MVAVFGLIGALVLGFLVVHRGDIPYATLEARYANAASRYLDTTDGLHVHYRDQGRPTAPAIVMIHGYGASLEAWEPWVSRLQGDYRVVTLDLPGHGLTRAPRGYVPTMDSYAELVEGLADHLRLGRFVVVGNSMGGAVALEETLRHPEHIRGLVLVDSAGWPDTSPKSKPSLFFSILNSPTGRTVIRDINIRPMVTGGLEQAYVDRSLVTPGLVTRYFDLARAPGHRDILIQFVGSSNGQLTVDAFRRIRVPTLVLHGRHDALIPYRVGENYAGAIPGAKLILYDGVGHVPMEQIPDRSSEDLREFLAGLGR